MSRASANKLYNNFVKGLITEASYLTYPENSTIDELNCTLSRKGNRDRRLGVDIEYDGVVTPVSAPKAGFDSVAISEYKWESVANRAGLDYLVLQVGLTLYFFDMNLSAVSRGVTSLNINVSSFVRAGETNPASKQLSMSSGKGFLFIVGEHIEPILVSYNRDTNQMLAERIYIQIRDFQGVDDGLANDAEPTTLSNLHKYNLINQGWVDPANTGSGPTVTYFDFFGGVGTYNTASSTVIDTYFAQAGRYPPNNKVWWMAKNSENVFDPALLQKTYVGNSRAPRGRFIVDAFNINRSAVSGVPNIPIESTYERPNTVSFFSGRVWYATNSTVYFSQVLDDKRKAGFCYQEADPTSEDISDLIATDGGVIPIPEMSKAVRLFPSGSGILVFATNGIWMISGTSAGFTATDISVSKISPIGTESPNSIVEAEGQFFWWSKVGIMGMSQKVGMFGPIEGGFDRSNISENTVQTLYNNISPRAKQTVKSVFDPATNTVQWIYFEDGASYRYDRVLSLDLTLMAFYPWKISSTPTSPWISGVFTTQSINDLNLDITVDEELTFVKYVSIHPVGDNYFFSFSNFRNTRFADWGVNPYLSFIETGYELLQDAMRKKQIPYVVVFFRQTEEAFVEKPGGVLEPKHQSSCYVMTKWDWASSNSSGKYTNKEQAYRLKDPGFVDNTMVFDTGFPVVTRKMKVRGSGRAIQFRFECDEIERDFSLLGWSVNYSGNTNV